LKTNQNPKGAGRKQAPYKTTTIRVPLELKEHVYKLIKDYKNEKTR